MTVICYTFDADHHCISCTRDYIIRSRTGEDIDEYYVESVLSGYEDFTDGEGNPIHPLFDINEWYNIGEGNQTLTCGDCGTELDIYEEKD